MSVSTRVRALAKPVLYRAVGQDRSRALAARVDDTVNNVTYRLLPEGRSSLAELHRLRDSHRGERCFIIGNGPSLSTMDLAPLRNEFTFGLNRIYLMFEKLGFATDCLVCINRYVIEQSGIEVLKQPSRKFVTWRNRGRLPRSADVTYVRSGPHPGFATQPDLPFWEGATVTYVAMQLAYLMGFETVYLIGVDHSFATKGEPHKLVESLNDDPNHFDPSYFGKGYRWQLPDLETSEIAYGLARKAFEADGRHILDATVGGKLQTFDKVDYGALFVKAAA